MATYSLAPMHAALLEGLSGWPISKGPEGSTQSFKAGEILIWASGLLTVAADEPIAAIAGVALHDASGVSGKEVLFMEARQGVLFEATLDDTVTPNHALVAADRGAKYNLTVSSNKWFLDAGETDAPGGIIERFVDGYAIGDIRARVLFRFIPTVETP